MVTCQHCKKEIDLPEDGGQAICPNCRAVVAPASDSDWVAVARSTSIAEAGYLANLLSGDRIESRIDRHDSFNAIDGQWGSVFLLRVAASDAEESVELIREQLARDESGTAVADVGERPPGGATVAAVVAPGDAPFGVVSEPGMADWRPLALIIISGMAIVFIGLQMRHLREQPDAPSSRHSLLQELEKIDRPFYSRPRPGDPSRHRIVFDRHRRLWSLETDADGDGRFERHQSFQ